MIKRLLTVGALALTFAMPVHAGDANGRYAIKGGGRMTCDTFQKARAENSSNLLIFGGWIEGYVSAVNNYEKNTYDMTPWQTTELLLGLIAAGCENNPDARFVDVVGALFKQLYPQRVQSESPIGKFEVGETGIFMYQAVLKSVQTALNAAGYDVGTPTGLAGPETVEALVAYQKANGLKETGLPDQATLYALLLKLN